jgi:hypothetical protein
MKINWTRFALVFLICQIALVGAGCTATWISAVSGLVPVLNAAVSAILSFVLALQGKTVTAEQTAAIQRVTNDVNTQLTNLEKILAAAAGAGTAIASQISAIMNSVVQNLQSILAGFSVSDPSTTSKITQLVNLAIVAAQAILSLLPLLGTASVVHDKAQLESLDKIATASVNHAKLGIQEAYKVVIETHTVNADVKTALDSLPRSL